MELLRRRQRHREEVEAASWLTRAGLHRFASGEAGVFQLNDLNRAQTGMIGGAGTTTGCSGTWVVCVKLTLYDHCTFPMVAHPKVWIGLFDCSAADYQRPRCSFGFEAKHDAILNGQ